MIAEIKSKICLIGLISALTFSNPITVGNAFGGVKDGGNGGGGVALEFKYIAHSLYDYFSKQSPNKLPKVFEEVSLKKIEATIEHCKVIAVENFTNETNRDSNLTAKNYAPDENEPYGRIEIKISKWVLESQKAGIVFHEILGVNGFDRNYEASHILYGFVEDPEEHLEALQSYRLAYLGGRIDTLANYAQAWISEHSFWKSRRSEICLYLGRIETLVDVMYPDTDGYIVESKYMSDYVKNYLQKMVDSTASFSRYCDPESHQKSAEIEMIRRDVKNIKILSSNLSKVLIGDYESRREKKKRNNLK